MNGELHLKPWEMFRKHFFITLIAICQLLWSNSGSFGYVIQFNESESNKNLSVAINFMIESANVTTVQVVGYDGFFKNDFQLVSQRWRDKVSLELVNTDRKKARSFSKNVMVLIFADQINYFSLLLFMKEVETKMRKNRIVFITSSKEFGDRGLFDKIFSDFWSMKILNFIVLLDYETKTDVHTYMPFANNKCREFSVENIVKMGEFSFKITSNISISFESEYTLNVREHDTHPSNKLPFFPNKIPLNLNKCEITVSAYSWPPNVIDINTKQEPGIEIDFLRTIGRQMNGNVSITLHPDPNLGLTYGPDDEVFGRLAYLKAEMVDLMVPIPAQTNILRDFDTSSCYLHNAITFMVPIAGIFPSSKILWTVIEKNSSLFLLIVGVVLILSIIINSMTKMLSKIQYQTKSRKFYLHKIFITLLRSLIETSTPTMPSYRMIQWIYCFWFVTCLIISSYFTTTLTSFFTEPGRLRQIDTVQQIIDSKMPVSFMEEYLPVAVVSSIQREYLKSKNIQSSVLVGLKKGNPLHMFEVNSINYIALNLRNKAATGKAATYTDISRAEHISVQWVSSSGKRSIYYIRDANYLSYWNNIIAYQGNAIFDRVNNLVKRINQSGYWDFQKKRYYNRRLIQVMIRQYLMVYNYQHGIDNDILIDKLNEDFHVSNMIDLKDEAEKSVIDTNEQGIIQRFVRTDKTLVTWSHLSTVFKLWAIGIGLATISFFCELLRFRYSDNY